MSSILKFIYMTGLSLSFIAFTGCAYPQLTTPYTSERPPESQASIYLYRTQTAIDSANPDIPRFFINNQEVGRLSLGGYYLKTIQPGQVRVTYKTSIFGIPLPWESGLQLQFTALPGKKYFVKFSIETILRLTKLELMPEPVGEAEITSTKLLKLK